MPAARARRVVGLSVALDAGPARGHEPALGRQQLVGRRAQPQRGPRRRRDAGQRRPASSRGSRRGCGICRHLAYPAPDTIDQEAAERGRALYVAVLRRLPWHGRPGRLRLRYSAATRRSARSSRSTRSAPIPGRWASYTPELRGRPELALCGLSLALPAISARPTATPTIRSTASGRARPICTTARCRRSRDLLEPAEARPAVWYRGSDELDLGRVGYRSEPRRPAGALPLRHLRSPATPTPDTKARRYGTDLPAADKDALVEYMKTL